MKMQFSILWLMALAGLVATNPAAAEGERVITAEEVSAKRGRAVELTARAKALRKTADAVYQQETAECRKSVLVNNCLTRARDRRLEKVEEARSLEMDVGSLEREIRRHDLTERRAERARRLEQINLPTTVTVDGAAPATLMPGDKPSAATRPEKAE